MIENQINQIVFSFIHCYYEKNSKHVFELEKRRSRAKKKRKNDHALIQSLSWQTVFGGSIIPPTKRNESKELAENK